MQSEPPQDVVDEVEQPRGITFFDWFRWRWGRSTVVRPGLTILNGFISAICVCIYVYDTYYPSSLLGLYTYLVASFTFSVEYILKLLGSKNKVRYVFFSDSIIDLVTIAAGFINFWQQKHLYMNVGFLRLLRMFQVLRFFKSLSALSAMWLRNTINPTQLELYKQGIDLFLVIFCVVFVGGCAFFEIEGGSGIPGSPDYLHQAVYWACVTITTIGYGDYYPGTALGQLLFPLMILIVLIVVPVQVAAMTGVLTTINAHMRRVYKSWRFGAHVVLLGNVNYLNCTAFIDEFFHPDRGMQEMELLIMRNSPPDPQLSVLLSSHHAQAQCKFLQGSPFVAADLTRCDVAQSMAVLVLCNKYAQDPADEDTRTLITVLALAQYLRMHVGMHAKVNLFGFEKGRVNIMGRATTWRHLFPKNWAKLKHRVPHIIAQFHLPETIYSVRRLLDQQSLHPLELGMLPIECSLFPLCAGFVKHALLGASLRAPGLLTMLSNMITTYRVPKPEHLLGSGWVKEYMEGAGHEIYEIAFPPQFQGLPYDQAVKAMYLNHGAILIGARNMVTAGEPTNAFNVALAPFGVPGVIEPGVTVGYVLAEDQDLALKTSGLPPTVILGHGEFVGNASMIMLNPGGAGVGLPNYQPSTAAAMEQAARTSLRRRSGGVDLDASPDGEEGRPSHHAAAEQHNAHHHPSADGRPSAASDHAHAQQPYLGVYRPPADGAGAAPQGAAAEGAAQAQAGRQDAAPGGDIISFSLGGAALGNGQDTSPHVFTGAAGAQGPEAQPPQPFSSAARPPGPVAEGVQGDDAPFPGPPPPPPLQTIVEGARLSPAPSTDPPAPAHTPAGPPHRLLATSMPLGHSQSTAAVGGAAHQPRGLGHSRTIGGWLTAHNPLRTAGGQPASAAPVMAVPLAEMTNPVPQVAVGGEGKALDALKSSASVDSLPRSLPSAHTPQPGATGTWSKLTSGTRPVASRGAAHRDLTIKSAAQRLRRLSRAQPLTHVEEMSWADGQRDLVLIIGSSAFDHLDDLLGAIACDVLPTDLALAGSVPSHRPSAANAAMQHSASSGALAQHASQPLGTVSAAPGLGAPTPGAANTYVNPLGAMPEGTPFASADERLRTRRHVSMASSRFVVMDPEGPTDLQASQINPALGALHLKADPMELGEMRKLRLPHGCMVRALVLPKLTSLEENSALGAEASQADADAIHICSNLRQYSEYVGASLEVWTEAILQVAIPFLLPLCMGTEPYFGGDTEVGHPVAVRRREAKRALQQEMMQAPTLMGAFRRAGSSRHATSGNGAHPAGPAAGGGAAAHAKGVDGSGKGDGRPMGGKGPKVDPSQRHLLSQDVARKEEEALHSAHAYRSKVQKGWDWGSTCRMCASDMKESTRNAFDRPTAQSVAEQYVSAALATNPGLSPMLATGRVFTASILDKLFCQVLFSPLVVQILMKMVGVWDQGHEPERPAAATAAASDLTGSYSLSAVGPPSAATAHGACQQQQQGGGNGPPSGTNVPAGAWQQHQQQARQGSVGGPQAEAAAAAAAFASAHQHSTRLHSFPLLQLVGGLRARVFPRVDWAALLQADEQQVALMEEQQFMADVAEEQHGQRTLLRKMESVIPGKAVEAEHLPRPDEVGTNWQCLFVECVSNNLLPLGLYRRDPSSGFPYVYTSPDAYTRLRATDEVFVLASLAHLPPRALA